MHSNAPTAVASNKMVWTGRILSGVVVLFLLLDCSMKILKLRAAVEGTVALGYPESAVVRIGIILLVCLVLHVIPRTAVLGAVLLTGYLGGAVASNIRVSTPLFAYTLAPVYVGILLWGGLFLRDERVRARLGRQR